MTKLHELNQIGQSIWYDNIQRSLITDGGFQALIDDGIVGVTSNPAIFKKAIADSSDYDAAMAALIAAGKSTNEIYETLAMDDIAQTADLFLPVYEATDGLDGYVSLEVDPTLANDTETTISEGRRLFAALNRPNVMIKVPATPAGIPAIRTLISEGVNVNVTLLFAVANYHAVAEAYIDGLTALAAKGGDVSKVASVASFFVSRVDAAVEKELEAAGNSDLQGKIAIANAKVAYGLYHDLIGAARWQALAAKGARPQRLLWASTSPKNPSYPDVLYMDALIGPDTVNTVPPATLDAFMDHGMVASPLGAGIAEAKVQITQLADLGIDLDAITTKLQADGVASFAAAFGALMESTEGKRTQLLST